MESRNQFRGIDSPAYVAWRAGTKNMVVVPVRQAGNRFLGSINGLQIRAQIWIQEHGIDQNEQVNLIGLA
jgi:hypothetical protein